MSQMFEDRPGVRDHLTGVWRGKVTSNPIDFADRVDVKLQDMANDLIFPNLRWMSRDEISLPIKGDDCLVIFDNDREPWVIAWWPFDNRGA